jgi:hypothetical protein
VPDRLQRKRTPGSHLPEGTVCVTRGTKWGNPFTVAGAIRHDYASTKEEARKVCVDAFRTWLLFADTGDSDVYIDAGGRYDRRWMRENLPELRGLDLACLCPLPAEGEPDICHAAVLLKIANQPED